MYVYIYIHKGMLKEKSSSSSSVFSWQNTCDKRAWAPRSMRALCKRCIFAVCI